MDVPTLPLTLGMSWAQLAYDIYGDAVHWHLHDGADMPPWSAAAPTVKQAWEWVVLGLLSQHLQVQGQALLVTIVRKQDQLLTAQDALVRATDHMADEVTRLTQEIEIMVPTTSAFEDLTTQVQSHTARMANLVADEPMSGFS